MTTWLFRVSVVARRQDGTPREMASFVFTGMISNEAGTTSWTGSAIEKRADTSAGTFLDATVEADDTNDALVVKVTGVAAKTYYWVAKIELTEVTAG